MPSEVTLNSGARMPTIAYGTGTKWFHREGAPDQDDALEAALLDALESGVRHIDMAEMYSTDAAVGNVLRKWLAAHPRDDLFLTNKVDRKSMNARAVEAAVRTSLSKLGVDHLDLYLMHCPFNDVPIEETWKEMEALVEKGLVRAIGVSNFWPEDLKRILAVARIKPAVNQLELHPYLQQPEVYAVCREHGIVVEAYSPLAPLVYFPDGPVSAVAQKIASRLSSGATPAQVLLQWVLAQGFAAVTTSSKRDRLAEALGAGGLQVTDSELEEISAAGRAGGPKRKFWIQEFGGAAAAPSQ